MREYIDRMTAGTAAISHGKANKAALLIIAPLLRTGAGVMGVGIGIWLALKPLLRGSESRGRS